MPNEKPLTKSQFLQAVADQSGMTKVQVTEAWDAVLSVIRKNVGPDTVGSLSLPGLLKIVKVEKPAQPAKMGVPNPFKPGELMDVAAKPAKSVIKLRPLKGLKDMI